VLDDERSVARDHEVELLVLLEVARGDRFLRPEKNTFSLKPEPR